MQFSRLLIPGVLILAWLLPNHYYPWSSFWQEALAAFAFGVLLLLTVSRDGRGLVKAPYLAIAAAILAAIPLLQWQLGLIHFAGDAWMASLYMLGFGLAVLLPSLEHPPVDKLLAGLAWATLIGALFSVALALCQWLGVDSLGLFLAEMPTGGRPYANLAQPNQLATLLMLGLVSAGGLYHYRRLSGPGLGSIAAVLCFGVVMTQSRTGWLEMGGVCLWTLAMRQRAALRLSRAAVVVMGASFVLLVLSWPALNEALYLVAGRGLDDSAQFGRDLRWPLWLSMMDAIGREPWWGYGWNQVSVAQMRVAVDHPFVGVMIEHSHNVVLDLLVWNGVPLGLLLISGWTYWLWRHIRACRDATVAWLLAGISVLMTHGLLEFPLEYAYFLLPLGMMMGAVEQLSPVGRFLSVPRKGVQAIVVVVLVLFVWVVVEYVRIEEHYRQMRFELAGFGPAPDRDKLDDISGLTQLREFQKFARSYARREMAPQELDWMRRVAERYGYPPVLFRYALASALNGRTNEASRTLAVLCRIHPRKRCSEGLDAWHSMAQGEYPELKDVALPALPSDTPEAGQ